MNRTRKENAKETYHHRLQDYLKDRLVLGEEKPTEGDREFDYIIPLVIPQGKAPEKLLVELNGAERIAKAQVHHFLAQTARVRQKGKAHPMLWAPWIPDEMGEVLREAHAFYLDAVGNAYVDLPDHRILIDVRGRVPEKRPHADRGRILEPTGLMVLHHLLTRPRAINDPYRTLAHEAGVALGTVATVMRELQAAGYLEQAGKDLRKLRKKPELLELFIRGYALKLRPACFIGTYRHELKAPQQLYGHLMEAWAATPVDVAETGARAAEFWTDYLRADTVTLFVDEKALTALRQERMLPDAGGNLTLLRYFGPTIQDPKDKDRHWATPLLVYAELLQVGRPRETEAAGMIFDRYLKEELRES